jgi:hypothetical protein
MAELTSKAYPSAGFHAVQDLFLQRGWGDGLPVIPPTPDLVGAFVDAVELAADDVIGTIPEQGRDITVEKLAINAVAAGCREEYMSVLVATVRALSKPQFNLHSSTISGATAPLLIVSGPVVNKINLNTSFSVFGPGHHANATIGRAVRLLLQNVCGGIPGVLDRATFGHPGKYSYCIGESTTTNPWTPLHAERGVAAQESAVTVFSAEGPINARNDWASEPGPVLATIADAMLPSHYTGGSFVVVIGPLHSAILARAGLTKQDVQAELFQRARRSVASMKRAGRMPGEVEPGDEDVERLAVERPEDVLVVCAGGNLYGYSAVIPYWIAGHESKPVTEALSPGEADRCTIRPSRPAQEE